jgi:hypothetical protein
MQVAVVDPSKEERVRAFGGHSGLDIVRHVLKVRGRR